MCVFNEHHFVKVYSVAFFLPLNIRGIQNYITFECESKMKSNSILFAYAVDLKSSHILSRRLFVVIIIIIACICIVRRRRRRFFVFYRGK